MLKVFDWREEDHPQVSLCLEFDQVEQYYDNFGDYMLVKKRTLDKYLTCKLQFELSIAAISTSRNDVISCIKHSVEKHYGVSPNFNMTAC